MHPIIFALLGLHGTWAICLIGTYAVERWASRHGWFGLPYDEATWDDRCYRWIDPPDRMNQGHGARAQMRQRRNRLHHRRSTDMSSDNPPPSDSLPPHKSLPLYSRTSVDAHDPTND
ncbi:hypothetical protein F4823DRAFT_600531 [Ustulina deusta]|nr:hypothetical protein F4823DRAFT_600531 [Ustulina deusta]